MGNGKRQVLNPIFHKKLSTCNFQTNITKSVLWTYHFWLKVWIIHRMTAKYITYEYEGTYEIKGKNKTGWARENKHILELKRQTIWKALTKSSEEIVSQKRKSWSICKNNHSKIRMSPDSITGQRSCIITCKTRKKLVEIVFCQVYEKYKRYFTYPSQSVCRLQAPSLHSQLRTSVCRSRE